MTPGTRRCSAPFKHFLPLASHRRHGHPWPFCPAHVSFRLRLKPDGTFCLELLFKEACAGKQTLFAAQSGSQIAAFERPGLSFVGGLSVQLRHIASQLTRPSLAWMVSSAAIKPTVEPIIPRGASPRSTCQPPTCCTMMRSPHTGSGLLQSLVKVCGKS